MFRVSGQRMVIEACRSGVMGTFPTLNQLTTTELDRCLGSIAERLEALRASGEGVTAFGVNLIVRRDRSRWKADLDVVVKHRVPLVITSLGDMSEVVERVHEYGGLVFHDVVNRTHAEKAIAAGVDGLVLVCAGAGGHAGSLSPFALLGEMRRSFTGCLVLAGAITTGRDVAGARVLGADLAYMGTRFMATDEALCPAEVKEMIVGAEASDIVFTDVGRGVPANYLAQTLPGRRSDGAGERGTGDPYERSEPRTGAWSAGQGCGAIQDVVPVRTVCHRLREEYVSACRDLGRYLDFR